jgi:alkanesulfonate monooxygenase SsuD/methylene tetrahydromethanopterin reductase-like flavin-dependent oxidoreductase (luciferase family)
MEASSRPPLHLAVALDGAGWHPAAWRDEGARPAALLTPGYWTDLVEESERGLIDFVTFDDQMGLQSSRRGVSDERVDRVRGRLDAVLTAARVAPATRHIGLVPVATTTHTEPFHVSKAIATLDYVSEGRAGVQVRVSATGLEARLFGRRDIADRRPAVGDGQSGPSAGDVGDLFDEAADFVEVVRRLWDSWEDGAEIRDASTGRFVDRDRLHYIEFEGRWFDVRGPSITPRPPQGQPVVSVLAHVPAAFRLAARCADVVFVTPHTPDQLVAILAEVRQAEKAESRVGAPLKVFVDVLVHLEDKPGAAADRRDRLDRLDGRVDRSDAPIVTATPEALADLLVAWHIPGVAGFRLRPAVLPRDLEAVTDGVVPILQQRGVFRTRYGEHSLRDRLGLARPANRYVTAGELVG